MTQVNRLKSWIAQINANSNSDSLIINVLVKIQPHTKTSHGIRKLQNCDGVGCLLKLIQKPNAKILDISSSILANCLTEDIVRKEVLKCKGIPVIVNILRTIKHVGVVTRTCRSIANLANHSDCAKSIHSVGTVPLLLRLVTDSTSSDDCTKSALRALRNLADTPGHRKKLIQQGCVATLSICLESKPMDVLASCVSTLVAVSRSCTWEFVDHMLGSDSKVIKQLVKIVDNDNISNPKCKDDALSVLAGLTLQGCARPSIGNTGGLRCIVDKLKGICEYSVDEFDTKKRAGESWSRYTQKSGPLAEISYKLVGALCYCCREAINRAKLRSLDALPLFIKLLTDTRWSSMHPFILTTLLCFVYDEEGLKGLHDNGIFPVLLSHLRNISVGSRVRSDVIEPESSEDKSQTVKSEVDLWDGHDLDSDEEFDRRHSLSCDIPSRFNKRTSLLSSQGEEELVLHALAHYEVDWKNNTMLSYSPQWSPEGCRSTSDQLLNPTSLIDNVAEIQREISSETFTYHPLIYQDESSSSRDGFDQMHSPALLPACGSIWPNEDVQGTSRSDFKDQSSQGNVETNSIIVQDSREKNCQFHDSGTAPQSKRQKVEKIEKSEPSRNRELHSTKKKPNRTPENVIESISPTPKLVSGSQKSCSLGFLQFVSETCSVPPSVLQHAGRDMGSKPNSPPGVTSTQLWKQTRRRRLSGTRKTEQMTEDSNDLSGTAVIAEESSSKRSQDDSTDLQKDLTSSDKESSVAEPVTSTIDHIILCLICHYCEMADSYVASLAQQASTVKSLTFYITNFTNDLSPRLPRIIDRLSSCGECFRNILTTFLLPSIEAAAHVQAKSVNTGSSSEQGVILNCNHCCSERKSCFVTIINTMWHNFGLAHSSVFGFNIVEWAISNGSELEMVSTICSLVFLALWYHSSDGRMKNLSLSMLTNLITNLQTIVDNNSLKLLLKNFLKMDTSSLAFQSIAFVFYSLAGVHSRTGVVLSDEGFKECTSESDSPTAKDRLHKESTEPASLLLHLFETVPDKSTNIKAMSSHKIACKYRRACMQSKTDKTLGVTAVVNKNSLSRQKLRSSKLNQSSDNTKLRMYKQINMKIHTEILCEKSPMFKAMFFGMYRESNEKSVQLSDVPYEAAIYIIHEMYGCDAKTCRDMKRIVSEMKANSSSRYERFCTVQDERTYIDAPVEISICKLMDQWLLPDPRTEFCKNNKNFFTQCYVNPEILSISECKKGVQGNGSRKRKRSPNKTSEKVVLPPKNFKDRKLTFPYLKFVLDHCFSDLLEIYLSVLLLPCFFHHDHLYQGQVMLNLLKEYKVLHKPFVEKLIGNLKAVISDFNHLKLGVT